MNYVRTTLLSMIVIGTPLIASAETKLSNPDLHDLSVISSTSVDLKAIKDELAGIKKERRKAAEIIAEVSQVHGSYNPQQALGAGDLAATLNPNMATSSGIALEEVPLKGEGDTPNEIALDAETPENSLVIPGPASLEVVDSTLDDIPKLEALSVLERSEEVASSLSGNTIKAKPLAAVATMRNVQPSPEFVYTVSGKRVPARNNVLDRNGAQYEDQLGAAAASQ